MIKYDYLQSKGVFRLFLITCCVTKTHIVAELGFISMGLTQHPIQLEDKRGEYICSVILPQKAQHLKKDVACALATEKFLIFKQ